MIKENFYEFIILVNLGDCLKDINQLRKELIKKYDFKLSRDTKKIDEWLIKTSPKAIKKEGKELIHLIREKCKKIINKYQNHNTKDTQFFDAFFRFVVTGDKVFITGGNMIVKSLINKKTGKKEVLVSVGKHTTPLEWKNSWNIVKRYISELPEENNLKNKNLLKDFETRLKIYKAYLRRKNQFGEKRIYKELYKSEEIDLLLSNLDRKATHGLSAMIKIIKKFQREYSYLDTISPEELSNSIT